MCSVSGSGVCGGNGLTFALGVVVGIVIGVAGLVALALFQQSKAERAIKRHRGRVA